MIRLNQRGPGGQGREERAVTKQEEIAAVMQIMRQTNGKPEERERRLAELARRESICPGVVCRCNERGHFCPRHGVKT